MLRSRCLSEEIASARTRHSVLRPALVWSVIVACIRLRDAGVQGGVAARHPLRRAAPLDAFLASAKAGDVLASRFVGGVGFFDVALMYSLLAFLSCMERQVKAWKHGLCQTRHKCQRRSRH